MEYSFLFRSPNLYSVMIMLVCYFLFVSVVYCALGVSQGPPVYMYEFLSNTISCHHKATEIKIFLYDPIKNVYNSRSLFKSWNFCLRELWKEMCKWLKWQKNWIFTLTHYSSQIGTGKSTGWVSSSPTTQWEKKLERSQY